MFSEIAREAEGVAGIEGNTIITRKGMLSQSADSPELG